MNVLIILLFLLICRNIVVIEKFKERCNERLDKIEKALNDKPEGKRKYNINDTPKRI